MYWLSVALEKSDDDDGSAKWLENAAKGGCVKAMLELGKSYLEDEDDQDKGLYYLMKAGDQGNAEAQYELGKYLTTIERYQAFAWYKKAALLKHADALYHLGLLYEEGSDPQCLVDAYTCYSQAADQDHILAWLALGRCYEDGSGVAMHIEKALEAYDKAASLGSEEGCIKYQSLRIRSQCDLVKAEESKKRKYCAELESELEAVKKELGEVKKRLLTDTNESS